MIPSLSIATGPASTFTTTNGAAYADLSGLSLFLSAGGLYEFRAFIRYSSSATTAVFQPTMNGTLVPNSIVYRVAIQINANGASNSQLQVGLGLPATPGGSTPAATSTFGAFLHGVVDVANAGTLTVAVKTTGTGTNTVQTNGRLLLQQIAE